MDAVSSVMGSIGKVFGGGSGGGGATPGTFPGPTGQPTAGGSFSLSNPLSLLKLGSGIFGTIGNIQANAAKNKVYNQEMAQMAALQNMTPAQLAAAISGLERPLSSSLVSSVGNSVQGQLAERGLSQAPGIYATTLSQALAPFQQQEQQMAINAWMQKLGLPIAARPSPYGPFPGTTDTSSIWQSLFSKMNPAAPAATPPYTPAAIGSGPMPIGLSGPTDSPIDLNSIFGGMNPGIYGQPATS